MGSFLILIVIIECAQYTLALWMISIENLHSVVVGNDNEIYVDYIKV